jgi:ATP-dependent Clp protease adaptor protein ClpS
MTDLVTNWVCDKMETMRAELTGQSYLIESVASSEGGGDSARPGSDEGSDGGSDVALDEQVSNSKVPPKYAVLLHNDDFTTMEFVIEVLRRFFGRTGDEAVAIMLKVHNEGKGVAGIYSFEIAETKAAQVIDFARSKGFPLLTSVEET